MLKLGVNIDHVATLRQARGGIEPDPITAALLCELAGADSIVAHLREDRRHINERDLRLLRSIVKARLNLEMSVNEEIVKIARDVVPDQATLVPEKRKELTTEGGLDIIKNRRRVKDVIASLQTKGIAVSLFVDPKKNQIEASREVGADFIELHTGCYAESKTEQESQARLDELIEAAYFAVSLGLRVNAGHGLNYRNVIPVSRITGVEELNIGHAIIAHALSVGMAQAVQEMISLIRLRQ